ncbi:MAG: TolC family protein [Bacteroidota bacterium]
MTAQTLTKIVLLKLCMLACSPRLLGQINPTDSVRFTGPDPLGRAVPVLSPGMGTPAGGGYSSTSDSLELILLQIEIRKAEEHLSQTSFWRRLIPQIHVSASFGIHDVAFIDPATFVPYVIPHDSYRLTAALSLSDLFNSSPNALASLELERLNAQIAQTRSRQHQSRQTLLFQLNELEEELHALDTEVTIAQDLLRFDTLRFQQGKIEFDALMHTKLNLNNVTKTIHLFRLRKQHVRSVLSNE